MEVPELEALLERTPYAGLAASARRVSLKGFEYPDLFRVGGEDGNSYAVKLRPADQANIADSLACLAVRKDPEGLIQDYTGTFVVDGWRILVSPWLEGRQPIDGGREALPRFFALLARFNRDNPSAGPYTSMYLNGRRYAAIAELVDAEVETCLAAIDDGFPGAEAREALGALKSGLACLVNEDVNTGNMFFARGGKPVFIDTEWLHSGLNLHQFDHLNLLGFDEEAWYNITEEARDCYVAYFEALGLPRRLADEQIRARELLAVLRQDAYWRWKKEEAKYPESARRARIVLDTPTFI